ncbi:MAG TPA: lytic transglycosylase domain-containing protein [Candidatus Dormibacteraeota bacterium]|nr:lytic transglycosylase domain-containing protein [Candidatus Dormibacteraeota bacterium]
MSVVAGTPRRYAALIEQASATWGVPDSILSALLEQESGFNPSAVSPAGAEGIAQFLPSTASGLGVDPWDPASAIPGAARLLASYYQRFGSWDLALAAYNAGPAAVASAHGVPPIPETQNYVASILAKAAAAPTAVGSAAGSIVSGTFGSDLLAELTRWAWLLLAVALVVLGLVLLVADSAARWLSEHGPELPAARALEASR